jgi:hypothetical protein
MHEFTKGVDAVGAVRLNLESCVAETHNKDVHNLGNQARVDLHKKWLQVMVEKLPVHGVHLDLNLLVAF